jgi:hypothetical protein
MLQVVPYRELMESLQLSSDSFFQRNVMLTSQLKVSNTTVTTL